MKSSKLILGIILLTLLAGCGKGNKQSDNDILTVDVTANYPKKELILQDFMDVEYIPLETNDTFVCQGIVQDIGKDIILVKNRTNDGNIFIFDRKGKAVRKINRLGQSSEEYSWISRIILDESNNEIFIEDSNSRKILVYDLYGNFKRSFKFTDTSYYTSTFNYDQNNLICYKRYASIEIEHKRSSHLIISKQDGSITREIEIPFKEIKVPTVIIGKGVSMPVFYPTIPTPTNWIVMNTSSDTIYTYLSEGTIKPFIVRTPSIHSIDPEIFLFPELITDRFYFMKAVKKEYDFATREGFPKTNLVYDNQEKEIFQYILYNADFLDKKEVFLSFKPVNHEIATSQTLEAFSLVEAYQEDKLTGKLKEIAATLDEESNPVIMLIKHKKR